MFSFRSGLIVSGPPDEQSISMSGLLIGVCVPLSCSHQDLANLIGSLSTNTSLTEDNIRCSSDKAELSAGAIAFLVVVFILVFVVLLGTLIDLSVRCYFHLNRSKLLSTGNFQNLTKEKPIEEAMASAADHWMKSLTTRIPMLMVFAEFSAIRTLTHIFKIDQKQNEKFYPFLNGIRVLSLFWVILGHSFTFSISFSSNIIDLLTTTRNFAFQLVSSGILSVDTFFILSGFLTAILFVRQVQKEKLSLRLMFLYYIHRYLRLTPAFVLVMFTSIYLTPYFGEGPLYPKQQGFEPTGCRDGYWWTSFLYIGNLIKPDSTCLGVTWYLFNDMQFHWIAPLALIPFALGRRKIGYFISIIFVLISIGSILGLMIHYPSLVEHALQTPNVTTVRC